MSSAGEIAAVFRGSGDVGCATIAEDLAVAIRSARRGKPIRLVDAAHDTFMRPGPKGVHVLAAPPLPELAGAAEHDWPGPILAPRTEHDLAGVSTPAPGVETPSRRLGAA